MKNNSLSKFQIWKLAIRLKTLPAAVAPVIIGISIAFNDGFFDIIAILASFIFALLLQIASNLANDYFDFIKGIDTEDRVGPVRVAASGLIQPNSLRNGLIFIILLIILVWIYLIWISGLPLFVIGVLSIIFALIYSGGPIPLGSKGLGDILVFIFFGLIAVMASYYIQASMLPLYVVIASVPIGLLITAILVVNNYRDYNSDLKAGKKTLAVIMGKRLTRVYFIAIMLVAYGTTVLFFIAYKINQWYLSLIPLISLPISIYIIKLMYKIDSGPGLNNVLASTARLSLIFSLLFSIGILIN